MQDEFRFEAGKIYDNALIVSRKGDSCYCKVLDDLSGHTSNWHVAHITSWTDADGDINEGFQLGEHKYFALGGETNEMTVALCKGMVEKIREKGLDEEGLVQEFELKIKAFEVFSE